MKGVTSGLQGCRRDGRENRVGGLCGTKQPPPPICHKEQPERTTEDGGAHKCMAAKEGVPLGSKLGQRESRGSNWDASVPQSAVWSNHSNPENCRQTSGGMAKPNIQSKATRVFGGVRLQTGSVGGPQMSWDVPKERFTIPCDAQI